MAALSTAVDTDGTGNYTSLNAAETAEDQDLTAGGGNTFEFICEASSGTADTTGLSINGWTTAAGNYILVSAKAGERAVKTSWVVAQYRLETANATALTINEDFVRLDGLQIGKSSSSAHDQVVVAITAQGAGSDIRIDSCRLKQAGNNSYDEACVRIIDPDVTVTIQNTIAYGIGTRATDDTSCFRLAQGTLVLYNSIAYGAGSGSHGVESDGGTTITVKNCAVFNNGDDFQIGGTNTLDFNASDDNDGGNNVAESGGGAAWPLDFNAAASGDFTLLTGSNLKTGGTTAVPTNDMDGDPYEDPASVGVDEFVAAGPSGIVVLRRRRAA